MAVGNTWNYWRYGNDKEEVVITNKIQDAFFVDRKLYLGDSTPVILTTADAFRNLMLLRIGDGGQDLYRKPMIICKFPLVLNGSWNYETDGGVKHKCKYTKYIDSLLVQNKYYYNIILIEDWSFVKKTPLHFLNYYAKNIGLIKQELEMENHTVRSMEELESFQKLKPFQSN